MALKNALARLPRDAKRAPSAVQRQLFAGNGSWWKACWRAFRAPGAGDGFDSAGCAWRAAASRNWTRGMQGEGLHFRMMEHATPATALLKHLSLHTLKSSLPRCLHCKTPAGARGGSAGSLRSCYWRTAGKRALAARLRAPAAAAKTQTGGSACWRIRLPSARRCCRRWLNAPRERMVAFAAQPGDLAPSSFLYSSPPIQQLRCWRFVAAAAVACYAWRRRWRTRDNVSVTASTALLLTCLLPRGDGGPGAA